MNATIAIRRREREPACSPSFLAASRPRLASPCSSPPPWQRSSSSICSRKCGPLLYCSCLSCSASPISLPCACLFPGSSLKSRFPPFHPHPPPGMRAFCIQKAEVLPVRKEPLPIQSSMGKVRGQNHAAAPLNSSGSRSLPGAILHPMSQSHPGKQTQGFRCAPLP